MQIAAIIPARDEAGSIGAVVRGVRDVLDAHVVVVDNRSQDRTVAEATAAGAVVVAEPRPGYGYACRRGVTEVIPGADVIVFLDGDGTMSAADIPTLLSPIQAGDADLVVGRRPTSGLMPWHQRLGNAVIALLLRWLYGIHVAELGPFRAIRATSLTALHLPGSRYAWPAEMLARAALHGDRITEVEVGYHQRTAGRSKVGGTPRGSLEAGWDICSCLVLVRLGALGAKAGR